MVGPSDLHDRETLTDMAEEELAMLDAELDAARPRPRPRLIDLAEEAAAAAQAALAALQRTPYSSKAATMLHVSLGQLSLIDKLGVAPDWAGCPEVAEAFRAVFYRYPSTLGEGCDGGSGPCLQNEPTAAAKSAEPLLPTEG